MFCELCGLNKDVDDCEIELDEDVFIAEVARGTASLAIEGYINIYCGDCGELLRDLELNEFVDVDLLERGHVTDEDQSAG